MAKKITCPFCQSETRLAYKARDYNRDLSKDVFCMYRCTECDLRFINNLPSNIAFYYAMGKLPPTATDQESWMARQFNERYKIELIKALVPSGKLLDIGPNMGEFAASAQNEGFDVSVIECDSVCVAFMRETLPVKVIDSCDPARILRQSRDTFDVICLWQAIEHLPEPWTVIMAAAERLRDDGILVIATPNPNAWQLKIMGRHWPHLDMPRHRFLLPMEWIKRRGWEHGLRPVLATSCDAGSQMWERASWQMLLTNLFNAHGGLWWNVLWKAGSLIGRFTQCLANAEGRGATYTLILQKQ